MNKTNNKIIHSIQVRVLKSQLKNSERSDLNYSAFSWSDGAVTYEMFPPPVGITLTANITGTGVML